MRITKRRQKPTALALAIGLGLLAGLLVYASVFFIQAHQLLWRISGKLVDQKTYLVYLPEGIRPGKKYTLVFALSPSADPLAMISAWAPIAEKHQWIIAASAEFRNGVDFDILLPQIEAELNAVETNYPVDSTRVIFTGLSGGGMGAHAVAKFFPARVSAIVVNTGMMEETFMTPDYPQDKLAVMLASPTDFRYTEMQRDKKFLEDHHWTVQWIEFAGGHTMAPQAVYEQAADWLEKNLQ